MHVLQSFLRLTFLALLISFCDTHAQSQPKHAMVVFVHGTLAGMPEKKVFKYLKKKKVLNLKSLFNGNLNREYMNAARLQGQFVQPIGNLGLETITPAQTFSPLSTPAPIQSELETAASVAATCFKQSSQLLTAHNKHSYSFYTYGWSGLLNKKDRLADARNMYTSLLAEKQKLEQHWGKVEITVLTHSHGGNVALNLGRVEEEQQKNLHIDNLVMYGVPIQSETECYVTSSVFEKVYSVYSKNDFVQVLDLISTRDFFSRRKFKKKYAHHVNQIQIKLDKTAPGHGELWLNSYFFLLYRKSLSIAPLPVSAFTPLLLNAMDQFSQPCKHMKVHLRQGNTGYEITAKNKATKEKWGTTYRYPTHWNSSVKTYSKQLKTHFKALIADTVGLKIA